MHVDYLIVGQGLAGTLLAHEVAARGLSYCIVDEQHRFASSAVAAGLFTPITGMRLVLSWRATEMLETAGSVYRELEQRTGSSFYHPLPSLRIFRDEEEVALWNQKQDDEVLQPHLARKSLPVDCPVPAAFGGYELRGAGWLDLKTFLSTVLDDKIQHERFDAGGCAVGPDGVQWGEVTARHLVLCEGFQAADNPWFARLPFRNAHGEVLTVRIPELSNRYIISSGVFLLPLGEHLFRLGATYDWDRDVPSTSEAGRSYLLDRVQNIVPYPLEVVDHVAGIRPVATQRVPVLGTHPEMPAVAIFNGLGSKGVMYAPFYARQLVDHLEAGAPLDKEVVLARRMK